VGAIHRFQAPLRLIDGRIVQAVAIIGGQARAEVRSGAHTLYVPLAGIQAVASRDQRALFSEVATSLRTPTQ